MRKTKVISNVVRTRYYLVFLLFVLTQSGNCQLIGKEESKHIDELLKKLSSQNRPGSYLIKNATIVTMRDSTILVGYDVLVENGSIKKIDKDIPRNASATEIDATGKFLMPGLVDMHAHLFLQHPLTNTWILHLLTNGVTTIRDMNGSPEKLIFRDRISRNEILAPTIYQATKLADSRKDKFVTQLLSQEEARNFVTDAKKSGYDFIKVYDGLNEPAYEAVLEESHRQNILVVGHTPDAIRIDKALQLKQNTIEHLTGYFEWKGPKVELTSVADFASLTASSDTWNCPTMYNHFLNGSREGAAQVLSDSVSQLIPQRVFKFWSERATDRSQPVVEIVDMHGAENFEILKNILVSLYKAKAKLLIGTDAGNLPFLIPGYSLHKEMEMMSLAIGIPNYELLRMATHDAATAMNKQADFGTIEEGKRADMILLDANPIQDLRNLRRSEGVMVRGIWISSALRKEIISTMKSIFGN
jgi:imidazolonepropionase-like amidohydrolase